MPTMKLVLFAVMGFCLCYQVEGQFEDLYSYSPEDQVDIVKNMLIFHDKHIVERWWATEDLTCQAVYSVWEMFNQSIASDLSLLMKEPMKHLKQVPPPRNRKMRRCIEDIKETIEEAVQEGVDFFKVCTVTSLKIQEQKNTAMDQTRDRYRKSVHYTLENLERCLEYSNKISEVHRKRCIEQIMVEYKNNNEALSKVLIESQCMAHFTNDILECTSKAFNIIVANKNQLKEDIDKCVGYSFFIPEQQNYSVTVNNILANYTDDYLMLTYEHDTQITAFYSNLSKKRIQDNKDREQCYHNTFSRYLQDYYDALSKTQEENRSTKERKCYSDAVEKLNNLTAEGINDYTECDNFTAQQRADGEDTLISIVDEFNLKLREGGNVALLRCFGQRPQNIFNSEAIRECAELARKSIYWERRKDQTKLEILSDSLKPKEILSNDKTCGWLREKKLLLDADKILNECTRCLYGGSGDFYAVTTPSTYTEAGEDDTTTETTEAIRYDRLPEMTEAVEYDAISETTEAVEYDTTSETTEAVEYDAISETTEAVEYDTTSETVEKEPMYTAGIGIYTGV